jgi:type I restriction enzyme M protein
MASNSTNGAELGFEQTLWAAADKLRGHLDAAEYKHVVLGLIFLKYISNAFYELHQQLNQDEYADPEDRDEYLAAGVFWVPPEARWDYLQRNAKRPEVDIIIDEAMAAIERDNTQLKGVLPQDYGRADLDKRRLGELIDLIGTIGLGDKDSQSKDILGRCVRIFLGPVRQRGRQEGRRILHRNLCRARAGRNARTVSGPRLRSLLRIGRDVRAVGEIHRGARWQPLGHFHLRAGIQPDHLETVQDESGDSRD